MSRQQTGLGASGTIFVRGADHLFFVRSFLVVFLPRTESETEKKTTKKLRTKKIEREYL